MAQIQATNNKPATTRPALFKPPFSFYMGGYLISTIGEWLDVVTLNWAVLQLTNSPLHLALINACRLIPVFLLSIPAGVLADRYDRRRLLLMLQSGVTLLTLALAALVQAGAAFWMFALIVTLRSVLMAMDPPIRNALIPNLVPREAMSSALAMNVAVANLSRIIGPAIAGSLLLLVRQESMFYLAACGFALQACTLFIIRTKQGEASATHGKKQPAKADVREAVAYIKKQPAVQSLLLLAVVPMVFGFPYSSMMPVFARDLLALGPDGFGALLSASAVGALLGSLLLSMGGQRRRAGRWLVCSLLGFGASLIGFMLVGAFLPAAVMMFWVGLFSQTYRTLSRITLQTEVPDDLRGRIMSIALMDRGFIPLGSLLIGAVAGAAGALWSGLMMGAGIIAITLLVLAVRRQIWEL